MKLQYIRKLSLVGLAFTFVGFGGTYSLEVGAQALEEVVVTARKREENLQDIPDSVVAISAEIIEKAKIVHVRDVTSRIPNVSIEESLSPTSTFIGVRGVVSTRNGEPAVSMVVDGVQIGSASEISQALHDVERIEVLKGPQGALYGRNAIGGAMLVTTKQPTDELEGKLNAGYGSGDLMEVTGSLSGPVTDNLKFRIAGNLKDFNGTITNEFLEQQINAAGGDEESAYTDFETNKDIRGRLIWTPTDATTADLRVGYSDLEAGSYWYRPSFRLNTSNNHLEFPIGNDVNSVAFRTIFNTTLKLDHEIDYGTFSSITSFTETEERYGVPFEGRGSNLTGDVDFLNRTFAANAFASLPPADAALFTAGGFLTDVGSHNLYDIENWSQEFRFTSNDEDRFRWVGGAYFLFTERDDTIRADLAVDGSPPLSARLANGQPGPTDFATTSGLLFNTVNTQDNFAWALFFSSDFDITDKLTLTAALRYDQDEREITRIDGPTVNTGGQGLGLTAFAPECTVGVGGCVARGHVEKETFSEFQPKVSLAYRPNDDLTLYTTYARGFRSGGFNASGALLADTYDKETLDSFEIGQKSTWLDGTLRFNAAAFYQFYDNVQIFEFDGAIFVQSLFNIPESEIYGVELDFEWAATDTITLSGALGLMESEITKFDTSVRDALETQLNARIANTVKIPPETQSEFDNNFKDNKLPKFPHVSANVGILHEIPVKLFGGSTLSTRLDYKTFGERYWWIDNADEQEFIHLFDGSISLGFNDNWEGTLWCKNCTDVIYDSAVEPAEMVLFGGAAKDVLYQARERTFGIQVNYNF